MIILAKNLGRNDLPKPNSKMSIFLRKQPTVIKEFDEKLVRRLIEKVTVHEDRFEVVFRSGVMAGLKKYECTDHS